MAVESLKDSWVLFDLMDLHRAALLLEAAEQEDALLGVRVLETALGMEEGPLVDAARRVLGRAATSRSPAPS